MRTVHRLSRAVSSWFAVVVIAAGAAALLVPQAFTPLAPAVPWLLGLIMLGMGMTLRPRDFTVIATRPWAMLLGIAAQYAIMPLVGLALAVLLGLPDEVAAGVVLVGACPGGTASNVMVFLARGDTALSVAMTTASTLLAPLLTPVIVLGLAGQFLPVSAGELLVSILQVVLVPVLAGVLLAATLPTLVERVTPALPLVSVTGIAVVVAVVVAGSADAVLQVGLLVVLAVVLHNGLGLALGYAVARLCRMPVTSRRAVSLEVGMQNSGLAATLAGIHFSPVAALPAAVFSVWHNVSGSALASWWARRPPEPPGSADEDDSAPGTTLST